MAAGYFSDKYGRRITIIVAIGINALLWVLQGVLPSYLAFVLVRILVQGANQAAYLTYNCFGKFHRKSPFSFCLLEGKDCQMSRLGVAKF